MIQFQSTKSTSDAVNQFLRRGGSVTLASAHKAHGIASEKRAHTIRVKHTFRPANTTVSVLRSAISSVYQRSGAQ